MDVPSTVAAALADRPVRDTVCLEAGAGAGKATAGLLASGAEHVYPVTNDREDAARVRERAAGDSARATVLLADLRAVPLADGAVDLVTAHGLFNVLPPASAATVAAELTRVAAPGSHLVVDDYEPPGDAAVRGLFAVENAARELADARPALTFYPAAMLRRLFVGNGWEFDRKRTLLDPVPWTASHVEAHAEATRDAAAGLPADLAGPLESALERRREAAAGDRAGTMYSLAFRL